MQSAQCMWLMQALGFLISALPEEQILGKLLSLLGPHLQQLEHLTKEPVQSSSLIIIMHFIYRVFLKSKFLSWFNYMA